ncbi:MAG: DUF393 domain-containing protein [Verrucomicrobia bacterium]|nr:DUF393 domain-containing protein [Verrucomicrobiota bacterium]
MQPASSSSTAPDKVASPPARPLMILDGDCGFCGRWIARWKKSTGEQVDYVPFQDSSVAARFPELPRRDFENSVHLLETDGRVSRGAQAVLRSLALAAKFKWLLWLYENFPGFASISEWAYRRVANNRALLSSLSKKI